MQLTKEQAIEQNQKMLREWADECKEHGDMGYLMLLINDKREMRVLCSEMMDQESIIRHLQLVVDTLKRKIQYD